MRNLTTELVAFGLDHWHEVSAFAVSQAASADQPGFAFFEGPLVAPSPSLDLVVRPGTGTAPMIRFKDGPVWVDVPDDQDRPPEAVAAAATAPASGVLVLVWEFEPGAWVWTPVAGPVPPVEAACDVVYALLAVARN